jgi:Protein of unknown function (DUF2949)
MYPHHIAQTINFLKENLSLPQESIDLALKQSQSTNYAPLPIVLWNYGLIDLSQLDKLYDHFENTVY